MTIMYDVVACQQFSPEKDRSGCFTVPNKNLIVSVYETYSADDEGLEIVTDIAGAKAPRTVSTYVELWWLPDEIVEDDLCKLHNFIANPPGGTKSCSLNSNILGTDERIVNITPKQLKQDGTMHIVAYTRDDETDTKDIFCLFELKKR